MYDVSYTRAKTIPGALEVFGNGDDPKYVAGGQTLIPTMKARLAAPSELIDVSKIEDLIGICEDGDLVIIGAGTTHAAVHDNALVKARIPGLAALAGLIGDPMVRHRGTLGGSVANNDPSADYPAAVLGLNATLRTDRRDVAADDFFVDMFETDLEEDELITAIAFPVPRRCAYAKFPNPASRYAMVGVLVAELAEGDVRVAVTGAGASGVFRWTEAEGALQGRLDDAQQAASALDGLSVDGDEMLEDMHGSAEYRAHLVSVMARRAVAQLQ
jgi:carbon-monoxide dehydrogenase medium subunit